jgi:hypothetical protein
MFTRRKGHFMETHSQEEHLLELRETGEAVGKLADDPEAFRAAVEALRAEDAERFQSILGGLDLLGRCHLICRWICSKHCVFICRKLCGPLEAARELDIEEMLEFARHTQKIAADEALLKRLLEAVDKEDEKAWTSLVERLKLQRFCHQLCHWLCGVRCRRVCRLVCPPPPLITKVAHIPTNQINPQGLGSGPSIPPGHTPADNKPAGDGDHPFGGLAHIEGNFLSVAGATDYKVEWAPAPAGPWTPILTAMDDLKFDMAFNLVSYKRIPDGAGWYAVSDIGLLGPTQLSDWPTPAPDGLYYLKLTARTGGGTEFASALVAVLVDNTAPVGPAPGGRPSIEIKQGDRVLGCCETVTQDGGPLTITVQATDDNFSLLSVDLEGGCGVGVGVFSKSYNGNLADTGAPAPGIDIPWDPWAAGVEPCCYVLYVRIWDRAIVNNSYAGRHANSNWHSITIA